METEPVKFKIQRVKKIHRKKENTTSCYFDKVCNEAKKQFTRH